MTGTSWHQVGRSLLGSWPDRIAAWGEEGIAAYVTELEARGVTPEQALTAIRSCPAGQNFPPSAPELAGLAHKDPSAPTFIEAYRLIFGHKGILAAKPAEKWFADQGEMGRAYRQAQRDRAGEMHPLVASFVERYGYARLEDLELNDPEYGDAKRRELERQWDEHCEATEGRDLAALALPRGDGGLRRLDPLSALGLDRPALAESTTEGVG